MNCVLMIYCIISLLMKQTTLTDKLDTDICRYKVQNELDLNGSKLHIFFNIKSMRRASHSPL